jgi:hypothetical protein
MPWQVLVAFILWWPLILIQLAGLALLGTSIAQYIGSGMGSVVTLLFAVGVGVPLLAVIAAEIPLVLFLRRGSRTARGWLLCLAIPMALLTTWPALTVLMAELAGTNGGLGGGPFILQVSTIGGVVAVLALTAALLPFLPPGNRFFTSAPIDGSPPPPSGTMEETRAEASTVGPGESPAPPPLSGG